MTSPQPATLPLSVFVSYSHRDEALKDELITHLANLKRQGKIRAWQDRDIEAGAEWDAEIKQRLEAAEIILLLISAQFIASDYCYDREMQQAIQRHDAGTARVIPIILKPCDWKGTPFSKLQVLPKDARPISQWSYQDEAFLNVVQGIRRAVESLQAKKFSGATISEPASRRKLQQPIRRQFLKWIVPLGVGGVGITIASQFLRILPTQTPLKLVSSQTQVNYQLLRDALAEEDFKRANEITKNLMFRVAGRESEEWLRAEDAQRFPCEDLQIIDQLWLHYSNGKFGFSVQQEAYKEIHEGVGRPRIWKDDFWEQLGDKVGWRSGGRWLGFDALTFTHGAPKGHLPWLKAGGYNCTGGICGVKDGGIMSFYLPLVQNCGR